MKRIEGLGEDVRHRVKRADWRIGTEADKTSVTWHYNGPPVQGQEDWTVEQAISFINRVDVPNHMGPRLRADGLQYHYVVLGSGIILQTRDLDSILWHCANNYGNRKSVAVHLPIGQKAGYVQKPTQAQLGALIRLTDGLINEFDMSGREVVFGHREWKGAATACPGPQLMHELQRYREGQRPGIWMHCRLKFDNVNVRQGPSTSYPQAMQLDRNDPLATFYSDGLIRGQVIAGSEWWVHRADHRGFIHESLVERIG